jgi:hypothetical protein
MAVLLVDASSPSLGVSAWLIAPLQGARRSDRKCALAGEIEQRHWRWRAYPGGACVWADRHLRPLPWIGLGKRGGKVGGEIPHAASLRVLARALVSVAHVRVKARQGTECARRYAVVSGVLVIDAHHRLRCCPRPRRGVRWQCGRRIAELGYHAPGVSACAASITRVMPPGRAKICAGVAPSRSGDGEVAHTVSDNAPPG